MKTYRQVFGWKYLYIMSAVGPLVFGISMVLYFYFNEPSLLYYKVENMLCITALMVLAVIEGISKLTSYPRSIREIAVNENNDIFIQTIRGNYHLSPQDIQQVRTHLLTSAITIITSAGSFLVWKRYSHYTSLEDFDDFLAVIHKLNPIVELHGVRLLS